MLKELRRRVDEFCERALEQGERERKEEEARLAELIRIPSEEEFLVGAHSDIYRLLDECIGDDCA